MAAQPQLSQDGQSVNLRSEPGINTRTASVEQLATISHSTNAQADDAEFIGKRKEVHPIDIGREAKRSKMKIAEGEFADSLEMERPDGSSPTQPRRSSRLRKG